MADSAAQPTTRSTFPPPPPWWRLYPPDAPPQFAASTAVDNDTDASSTHPPLPVAFGLPIFAPPLPPATPTTPYVLFNQAYTASPLPPLLPPNTPQLFDSAASDGRVDYARQLSALISRLLTHWLALLHALHSAQPAAPHEQLAELSHCYANITHLLGGLRRHQALQHVLLLVDRQRSERADRRRRLEAEVARCRQLLARHGLEWADDDTSAELKRGGKQAKEEQVGVKNEKEVIEKEETDDGGTSGDEGNERRGVEDELADDDDDESTEKDAAEQRRQTQLAALLDSIVDTGDY